MNPTPAEQVAKIVAAAKARAEAHGYTGEVAAHFVIGALTAELETALTKPKSRRKFHGPIDLHHHRG